MTSGEYAKHLGIIAAIRRDFSQLTSLMASSSDEAAEKAERDRLASDASARVDRFCDWMKSSADVRLTARELEALLGFLAPDKALAYFDAKKDVLFKAHFEGSDAPEGEARTDGAAGKQRALFCDGGNREGGEPKVGEDAGAVAAGHLK